MKYIAGSIVSILFVLLGLLHVYWMAGGKKWIELVLPQTGVGEQQAFTPSAGSTFIVALGLFGLASCCMMMIYHHYHGSLPNFLKFIGWGIAVLFMLRAIGEFNYVGFFKRVHHTPFAIHDTLYFSPLCIIIVILMVVLIKGE